MTDGSERRTVNRRIVIKTAVDALARSDVLWDTVVRGFGVRCSEGGTKTYIVQYRAGTRRAAPLRKYTIGRHGAPWTPDTARTEARRVLGWVAAGADAAEKQTAGKKAGTIAQLCETLPG